jgi:Flp pilus assembly protein TadG
MKSKSLQSLLGNTRGNMAVITALTAVPIFGVAGLAIDYMRYLDAQTQLRTAMDSAVLAGATSLSNHEVNAKSSFTRNAANSQAVVSNLVFKKSGNVRVDGSVSASLPSTMASLIGIKSFKISISAAAQATPTTTVGGLCIMTLSPNQSQEFLANSGASIDASSCDIEVKSLASPAAIFNAGTSINAKKLCIAGSSIIDNGGSHPNLQTGCATRTDPYAGTIAAPASGTCTYNNLNYSGTVTLSPGVYCGWMNFNAGTNVTLQPGTYVIKSGGWNVNGGNWSGSGVTFYFADTSKIQFNSAVAASLSAPTSGTYKDILMAEASGLSASQFVFDDSRGFDMKGVVYLPSRDVTFNSGTTTRAHNMTAIMRSVILNSTLWTMTPWLKDNPTSSGSSQARLLN